MRKYKKAPRNVKLYTLKVKAESNSGGLLKTLLVMVLIAIQTALMILSSLYLLSGFKYYGMIAMVLTIVSCVYVMSSHSNGQYKATWVLFLLLFYTFGFVIYFLSNEKVLFVRQRKKYKNIYENSKNIIKNKEKLNIFPAEISGVCNYLKNYAYCDYFQNSKIKYFQSGGLFFDDVIEQLKKAEKFIFLEFFIISDGVLFNRIFDIIKNKAQNGVEVRIIYDDMGCHNKLKRKTKKQIKKANIKIVHFNKLLPIFNLALNFRDHRKIIVVDGKVAYTGGVNLADEYTNERQMFGYWKDSGAQVAGAAVDNLTMAFLRQWEFITKESVAYKKYLGLFEDIKSDYVVAPFVSGPIFKYSIAKELYINMITSAKEYLYITTPYFIPEETFINLLISKAKSGVSVNLIIPQVPDKKMVYVVSRDYAERLISSGVNVYTMINSFVHGKVIINEGSAIIGSINLDHRSFNQQFESAVFTNEKEALMQIKEDMDKTILVSNKITADKRRRNKISYRIFAGILRLISPFM